MKDIRIGNDISVRWSLYKGDEAYDLTNLPVTLYLKNAYGKKKVEGYKVEGNQVSWTFYGKDQKNTGKYSMVLVIREGEQGMASTDYCDFVQLVSCACQVSGADEENVQTETIELTSEVDFPPIIVDTSLSEVSGNPIANMAVAKAFATQAGSIKNKVDKVEGLGLSEENYTTDEKEKLAGLENYDDTEIRQELTELSENLDKIDSDTIHITDANGNIILTIDANGIKTTDVEIKSGKISEVIAAIVEGLATKLGKEIDSDFFQVQDANGNIAFRIDSEGVHTPKSDSWIVSMILGETYIPTSTQRDENGDVQSAEIVYPDGNKGSITITSRESNGVTAMVIGYMDRVVSVTMERDSHGNVHKINIA